MDQMMMYRAFLEKGITKEEVDRQHPLYIASMMAIMAAESDVQKVMHDRAKQRSR